MEFLKIKKSVTCLQSRIRGFLAYRHYLTIVIPHRQRQKSVTILQSYVRCYFKKSKFQIQKQSILILQSIFRMKIIQKSYQKRLQTLKLITTAEQLEQEKLRLRHELETEKESLNHQLQQEKSVETKL